MGIDAEMMVRLYGAKPSDEQLAEWSWDLCAAIGADKFFIKDGVPRAEYRSKIDAWHKAFEAHPLHAGWPTDRSLGDKIRADIGQPPDERRRAIELAGDYDELEPSGKLWQQDGDDIHAGVDEWFLRLSLWTRYYGVGYERGDILTICAVAEWCEHNIPRCEVWYGGDSSGVCMEEFGPCERARLRAHLYSKRGRDYYGSWSDLDHGVHIIPDPCSLCVPGHPRFDSCGWGKSFRKVHCRGCSKSFVTRDEGQAWNVEEKS